MSSSTQIRPLELQPASCDDAARRTRTTSIVVLALFFFVNSKTTATHTLPGEGRAAVGTLTSARPAPIHNQSDRRRRLSLLSGGGGELVEELSADLCRLGLALNLLQLRDKRPPTAAR